VGNIVVNDANMMFWVTLFAIPEWIVPLSRMMLISPVAFDMIWAIVCPVPVSL